VPLPIKLTAGGRVITKVVNGVTRISCECCEGARPTPDCCYYPIGSLGTDFLEEDLPEEGVFYHNNNEDDSLTGPIILKKQLANAQEGDLSFRIIYGSFPPLNVAAQTGVYYFPQFLNAGYFYRQAQADPGGNNCLFDDQFNEENQPSPAEPGGSSIWFFDNFEDAYEVDAYTLPLGGPIESEPIAYTRLIVRKSLCEWGPVDEEFPNLLYNGTTERSPDRTQLWTFDYYFRSDGGPYNSPEGQYFSPSNIFLVRKA
jgi:hypothetical protein